MWRRSQEAEEAPDETERLLDLAAFADGRLDEDDTARLAALLARDADVAADVAAARAFAGATPIAADPAIVSRAAALVSAEQSEAELIAFPAHRAALRPWFSAASWGSLAAAVLLAGWLGFDLGSGLSADATATRSGDDLSASELLDPSPLLLRDFNASSQI
ncbi:MAG TPA: hypothetical protein VG308_14115 [Stellaceae bacterium]|jgi:anti-sigma factor RsiW|nr:hypothetical protein [Stellaceae bacterium]